MKLVELFEKVDYQKYHHQQTDYTCGIAGIRSILAYFGISPPKEDKLAQICGTDPEEGTLPVNMAQLLQRFGLNAKAGELTVEKLKELIVAKKPVILLFQHSDEDGNKEGHYATALEVEDDGVVVYDPYYHKKELLTWDKLERDWWSYFMVNQEYYRNWGIYVE